MNCHDLCLETFTRWWNVMTSYVWGQSPVDEMSWPNMLESLSLDNTSARNHFLSIIITFLSIRISQRQTFKNQYYNWTPPNDATTSNLKRSTNPQNWWRSGCQRQTTRMYVFVYFCFVRVKFLCVEHWHFYTACTEDYNIQLLVTPIGYLMPLIYTLLSRTSGH